MGERLDLFDSARAARCAFWLALGLLFGGELGRAGGWLARARRLLDDGQHDCVEQDYLLVPIALHSLAEGDAAAGFATFGQATRVAQRFDDPDLVTLARLGRGQALIQLGETAEGVALLDEVMVGLTADEVSPSSRGSRTARRSRHAGTSSICAGHGSGRPHLRAGAPRSPTWCSTAASATYTAPRSCS